MACKHGNRRPVKRGANSPVDPWQHGHEGGAERGDRRRKGFYHRLDPRIGPDCTGKPRGSGWDSGRTELPNPRAPPMPSDAD